MDYSNCKCEFSFSSLFSCWESSRKRKRYQIKCRIVIFLSHFLSVVFMFLFAVQLRFSLLLSMTETENEIKLRNSEFLFSFVVL